MEAKIILNNDQVQTRSETNGLEYWETLEFAFEVAKKDPTIWKISFNHNHERVRLIREGNGWMFESIKS